MKVTLHKCRHCGGTIRKLVEASGDRWMHVLNGREPCADFFGTWAYPARRHDGSLIVLDANGREVTP